MSSPAVPFGTGGTSEEELRREVRGAAFASVMMSLVIPDNGQICSAFLQDLFVRDSSLEFLVFLPSQIGQQRMVVHGTLETRPNVTWRKFFFS